MGDKRRRQAITDLEKKLESGSGTSKVDLPDSINIPENIKDLQTTPARMYDTLMPNAVIKHLQSREQIYTGLMVEAQRWGNLYDRAIAVSNNAGIEAAPLPTISSQNEKSLQIARGGFHRTMLLLEEAYLLYVDQLEKASAKHDKLGDNNLIIMPDSVSEKLLQ